MKNVARILPGIVLAAYMATLGVANGNLTFLRLSSSWALLLLAVILYRRAECDGTSIIDKGFLLYLALNAFLFWAFPGRLAHLATALPAALLYTVLCIMAAIPAITSKRYFTEYFARRSTPPHVWDTIVFKEINRNMTWLWIAIFAACALITSVQYEAALSGSRITAIVFQWLLPGALMLGVGVPLNREYPAHYQRKKGIKPIVAQQPAELIRNKEETMSRQLKVVAINGSPHQGIGNTSLMIRMLADTLSEEGIELEEILLAGKRIEYCVGCALCLEKGRCWRQDDHSGITDKLFGADAIILASPVYFKHVTAQMKTFIDRSLAFGHKPNRAWKPGLALTVSAGMAETSTAHYLAGILGAYGAFSIGTFTAMATSPGAFLGKDAVEGRARDLGRDLARAIKENRRYPATDENLSFYLFMRDLVVREKDFMLDDYKHWQESGLLDGFESYIGQKYAPSIAEPEMRKQWLKQVIRAENAGAKKDLSDVGTSQNGADSYKTGRPSAETCRELLKTMPSGFKPKTAGGLAAVYQFEITGDEEFTGHLKISEGQCQYVDGPYEHPDVTIKSPAHVWLAISRGEMDGQTAFMAGKYRAEGDMGLLMRLKSLFG
jgi:multimeric flavodoxin WrbA/putative sterol carrier protein